GATAPPTWRCSSTSSTSSGRVAGISGLQPPRGAWARPGAAYRVCRSVDSHDAETAVRLGPGLVDGSRGSMSGGYHRPTGAGSAHGAEPGASRSRPPGAGLG